MTRSDSLLWIDTRTDRDLASDGVSRYGAYLRQGAHRFRDWDDTLTTDAAVFAAQAFEIACAPVMSPPYVVTHPRVLTCVPHRDEDDRRALQVDLAMALPTRVGAALSGVWRGWQHTSSGMVFAPWDNDRPAAYTTLTLRLPFPASDRLPGPAYVHGAPHTPTARDAVWALVDHANSALGAVVAAVLCGGELS